MNGHRSKSILAAAVVSVLTADLGYAGLIVDLRIIGKSSSTQLAGPKEASMGSQGDVLIIGAFARISGANGINDEALSALHGSFASHEPMANNLLGNLSGGRVAPFTGASSQNGSIQDIDGDTDLDIGSTGSSVTGKFVARADAPVTLPSIDSNTGEIQVGQITWTYTGGGVHTEINFIPRTNSTGGNLASAATWFEDGAARSPLTGSFTAGAPVVAHTGPIPEPASAGLAGLGLLALLRRNSRKQAENR